MCKTKTNLREEMIKLEGYFQLLVLKVSLSGRESVTASPRSWTPDSSLRARKISVDIFFKRRRYFLSQFLSSFTQSPPSRSLTQFSSSQIFQESNHEAENLFSKDQWIWRKKEKATREFLTRRLILSSIERKKKKMTSHERDYPFSTEYRYVPRVSPSVSSTSLEQR